MQLIKLPSKEDMQKGLDVVMEYVISTDYVVIESYVDKLREQNKGISSDELAKKYYIENLSKMVLLEQLQD